MSFPVLYLAFTPETVLAEFRRMAARLGAVPEDFLPRNVYAYELSLEACLDLRPVEHRDLLSVSAPDLTDENRARCRAVGMAAHYLGIEGVIAPSATSAGTVLAVFVDRLHADSRIDPRLHQVWRSLPT